MPTPDPPLTTQAQLAAAMILGTVPIDLNQLTGDHKTILRLALLKSKTDKHSDFCISFMLLDMMIEAEGHRLATIANQIADIIDQTVTPRDYYLRHNSWETRLAKAQALGHDKTSSVCSIVWWARN